MVAPEVAPFVKVGGLADVAGALPKALARMGHDVRIVCPLYGSVRREGDWKALDQPLSVFQGGKTLQGRTWETTIPGSDARAYFLEHHDFYGPPEVYDSPWGARQDNDQRFAFLCRGALNLCFQLGWMPDVVHAHDWATTLSLAYLNTTDYGTSLGRAASVLTIHNLAFQGSFWGGLLDYAQLPRDLLFRPDNFESMGQVNLLKGGIYNATKVTTVSPTYAAEIQTPEFGCGLQHVLRFKSADLVGITNGIDTDEWNPKSDRHLPENFSVHNLEGKATCKRALQEALGLEVRDDLPLFTMVSRLYDQKGVDLLIGALPRILAEMAVQVVVIGNGDKRYEEALQRAAYNTPERVGCYIGFNNQLAHLAYAGSDFYLMPSRFEPCGLSQMYAMAYGSLPVARATGGLCDTVEQYHEGRAKGTGFLFQEASINGLYYTVGWACATWYDRPEEYRKLQQNAMKRDFSWTTSAKKYEQVYEWAMASRAAGFAEVPPTA